MVENLLSVTRIRDTETQVTKSLRTAGGGGLRGGTAGSTSAFPDATVHVTVPDEFIMVPMDATLLIEQVIINLLETPITRTLG